MQLAHGRVEGKEDFLARLLEDQTSDVVVIAGNNRRKTEYLYRALRAGMHVLADKPMVIDASGFRMLEQAFDVTKSKQYLLYDIMTERHEIATMLQKEFSTIS